MGDRLNSVHGFTYFKYGRHALLLEWSKSKSIKTLNKLIQFQDAFEYLGLEGILDCVPGYHSILIQFRPEVISSDSLINKIEQLNSISDVAPLGRNDKAEELTITVRYDLDGSYDLSYISKVLKLEKEKIIQLHTSSTYVVHFTGFLPGFIYLGGLDERLNIPRRATPRTSIPAGSVAIANGQTGIYPISSPGGWHIIGRTDVKLFDASQSPLTYTPPGTKVKFVAI